MKKLNFEYLRTLDKKDPLAKVRDEFHLPQNIIYFDGNSLGPVPRRTFQILETSVKKEWGNGLVSSWNREDWINMPLNLGNKIAPLVGALFGEVLVADSTSINLFKVLTSALLSNKNRNIIVSEAENFPTDLYILEGVNKMFGKRYKIHLIKKGDYEIDKYIDTSVAVVVLSHVNYKTGRITDIKKITNIAHKKGALVIWDISHSVGVVPIELHNYNVDFAVGCTYKHLNGGPGAPGFLYVNQSHIKKVSQPLTGWMGHKKPFDFATEYKPAKDICKYICGTPPIIAYKAIEGSLKTFEKLSIKAIRKKSIQLSDIFIKLMQQECNKFDFKLLSPTNSNLRGSQVSFTHKNSYAIIQALKCYGVIGDFRHPNILRFGISPLYMRFEDIWNAIFYLKKIMQNNEWRSNKFKKRGFVT